VQRVPPRRQGFSRWYDAPNSLDWELGSPAGGGAGGRDRGGHQLWVNGRPRAERAGPPV